MHGSPGYRSGSHVLPGSACRPVSVMLGKFRHCHLETERMMTNKDQSQLPDQGSRSWKNRYSSTRITPPIPRIGAYRTIRKSIAITCCTCWISFVQRVIRDAVENLWYSRLEKAITLLIHGIFSGHDQVLLPLWMKGIRHRSHRASLPVPYQAS